MLNKKTKAITAIRRETIRRCAQHWHVPTYKATDWYTNAKGTWLTCSFCRKFGQAIIKGKVHTKVCPTCQRRKAKKKLEVIECKGFNPMRDLLLGEKDDTFYTDMS